MSIQLLDPSFLPHFAAGFTIFTIAWLLFERLFEPLLLVIGLAVMWELAQYCGTGIDALDFMSSLASDREPSFRESIKDFFFTVFGASAVVAYRLIGRPVS